MSDLILRYWKWESIFGKLKFSDWDPIKKDNIVSVDRHILQAVA